MFGAPYVTNDLAVMVNNLHTPLNMVLDVPSVVRAVKYKSSSVIDYMVFHTPEMLRMVLSEDKSLESARAFTILSSSDEGICKAMVKNDLFRDLALEVITQPDVKPFVLGRLASITLALMQTIPEIATDSCGFIYHLIKYCANPSIYNFFTTICTEDPRFEITQKWLINFGIETFLTRELENVDFSYKSEQENKFLDPIYDKLICVYQLITKCAENQILAPSFKTKPVVAALINEIPAAPDFLKSAHWSAINAVACSNVAVDLLQLLPTALDIITADFDKLRSYRVSALMFITQMMELAPLTYDKLLESSVLQMLCSVLVRFPNSSILHGAFREFVRVGLKHQAFAAKMVGVCTPLFIDQASGPMKNRVLAPTLIECIRMFQETARSDPVILKELREVPEYPPFVRGELSRYTRVCTEEYGGGAAYGLFRAFKGLFD